MSDKYKDIIKIPESLDNAILNGLKAGKRKKKNDNKIKIAKRVAMVASIFIVSMSLVAMINPKLVSAIPIVSSIFEYITSNNLGEPTNKYENLLDSKNINVEKDGVKVTLDNLAIDDNILVVTLYIESDKLEGYDLSKAAGDFLNLEMDMKINGESPSSYSPTVNIINENKGAVIIEADVSKIDFEDAVNLNLNINKIIREGRNIATGPWELKINTTKEKSLKVYSSDDFMSLGGKSIHVDKLVISPLANILYISGKYNTFNDLEKNNFVIKDNYGNILSYNFKRGTSNNAGEYNYEIKILDDLSSVDYIQIIKSEGNESIKKEIEGFDYYVLKTTVENEERSNRKEEVISRKPTKSELDNGYGLDKVLYYVNIDRNRSFQTIDELSGKEISVNSSDKVTIKNIESTNYNTKITLKISGAYDYNLLSNLVILDENMNDIVKREGDSGAILQDEGNKLVTITLNAIEKNKRYTIAVPTTTDLKLDENSKITIKLKK
ncbi:DUF4179 domain-containing protein [Clostridium sp. LP20]|uniref:DUF4179 domain-containing protein n=1 Tax=Clostridium sp. LP20 TaxID=3418665 RepID=UPI003EE4E3CA